MFARFSKNVIGQMECHIGHGKANQALGRLQSAKRLWKGSESRPLCQRSCRLHRIRPMGALDEGKWLDTVRSSKSA
jgi:hypothetical protein